MPLMPIQVPQSNKKDALERIAQGLQIANGILGIPVGISTMQTQAKEREQIEKEGPAKIASLEAETASKVAQTNKTKAETAKIQRESNPTVVNAKNLIPGYSLTPGMVPKEEEVNKLKGMAATADDISKQIDSLSETIGRVGTELLPTQEKRDMALMATNIRLAIKNLAQLGQISASDAKLLDDMVPNPSATLSFDQLNPNAPEQMQNTLDLLKKTLVQKVDSQAGVHGYAPLTPREKYVAKDRSGEGRLLPKANADNRGDDLYSKYLQRGRGSKENR